LHLLGRRDHRRKNVRASLYRTAKPEEGGDTVGLEFGEKFEVHEEYRGPRKAFEIVAGDQDVIRLT